MTLKRMPDAGSRPSTYIMNYYKPGCVDVRRWVCSMCVLIDHDAAVEFRGEVAVGFDVLHKDIAQEDAGVHNIGAFGKFIETITAGEDLKTVIPVMGVITVRRI